MTARNNTSELKKFFPANNLQRQTRLAGKAHQLMQKIKAKYLATGDRVRFSRDGWQTVGRITSSNSLSVAFMFGDGVIRKLEAHREYVVEEAAKPPEPVPGQIMRLQKESNRMSVCSSHSLFDLNDISKSFRAIKQRHGFSNSAAAYDALERGATLYTHDAVYWMPRKWSGEATEEK